MLRCDKRQNFHAGTYILLKPKRPLIFVRHGQTPWNAEQRYQGSTDTSLSPLGVQQSKANAALIESFLHEEHLDPANLHLIASPLQRARQTAALIGQTIPDLPQAEFNPAFEELSLGRWEGLTSMEVKAAYYEERKSRKADRWNFSPVDGQSMAERVGEVDSALRTLESGSIIITHCGIMRIILHLLQEIDREVAAQADIPHIGLMIWDGEKISQRHT